ncbi:hypothetical protein [Rheinheimera salexigens]|uniref:Uncharacterized protein n=1 Tax=Rheinheimera salexigens TaxID=1628148 RepID=A0A1E7Q896_9GAMM|nr:hypothetical protein [Rheinheimera salexigens]OEY70366.1 hypothetical protein BI198_12865 [Rheinheimera salexigens]
MSQVIYLVLLHNTPIVAYAHENVANDEAIEVGGKVESVHLHSTNLNQQIYVVIVNNIPSIAYTSRDNAEREALEASGKIKSVYLFSRTNSK